MVKLSEKRFTLAALLVAAMAWLSVPAWAVDLGFAPVSGQVTSHFGWRSDPIAGGQRFHAGVDIAAAQGMPVYAPQAGYVMFSGTHGGYGNVVVLSHGNSLFTLYGHNSQLLVRAGETVYRGQVISRVGSTGRSTGPHLHFEVHYKGHYLNPMSYLAYIQPAGGKTLAQAGGVMSAGAANSQALVTAGSTGTGAQLSGVTVVERSSQAGKGKTVQLVSGSEVENIRF